jgi:hypothetical protein
VVGHGHESAQFGEQGSSHGSALKGTRECYSMARLSDSAHSGGWHGDLGHAGEARQAAEGSTAEADNVKL